MIYLDNAATTQPCNEAVSAAVEAMTENFGNPSSLHRVGLDAQLATDKARKIIADSIGADSSSVFFTSGATESNNLAIRGVCQAYGKKKRRIVSSSVEHSSVNETLSSLEGQGFEVVRVKPRSDGLFYAEDFLNECNEETVLITMMYVNNETGYIMPVKETFAVVKRRFPEIITHSDCVQAYMKIAIKVKLLKADLVSLSSHKVHGVKGAGALYVKKGTRLIPQITGGGQEKGIRSGTESVPLICAFGAAVERYCPTINERFERMKSLKNHLLYMLDCAGGIKINSPENSSPYIVNISVGKRSEIMLHFLESYGIYVSSGSACSKGQQSGVLGEFGITGADADSAIRISMTEETTEREINEFVEALREGISTIRG